MDAALFSQVCDRLAVAKDDPIRKLPEVFNVYQEAEREARAAAVAECAIVQPDSSASSPVEG